MSWLLEVDQLSHSYGKKEVLNDLSLRLREGEIGCLLGASGCGKTTLLRAIAGFERARSGEIRIRGKTVAGQAGFVSPEKRRVGVVFQDFALFPHLTVTQNIAFGLHRIDFHERAARVDEWLERLGLWRHRQSFPHQLSGGEQQRVALARALAPGPDLVLLDEPFSSLDVQLRQRLAHEVREILLSQKATALLVTHDQQEAFAIADQVGVLSQGRLEQWSRPYELYHEPASRGVGDFIGEGVFLPAQVAASNRIEMELGDLYGKVSEDFSPGCAVEVLLRPDDVVHDDLSPVKAMVVRKAFRGSNFLYTLSLPSGRSVLALVPSHHDHPIGEKIGIRLEVDHLVLFRRET